MTDNHQNTPPDSSSLEAECNQLKSELEKALREKALLHTVLDLIPDSIFAKDKHKRFILSNLKHYRSLGCATIEDILGKRDADFFPEALSREFESIDDEIIHSGVPLDVREEYGIEPTTGEKKLHYGVKGAIG